MLFKSIRHKKGCFFFFDLYFKDALEAAILFFCLVSVRSTAIFRSNLRATRCACMHLPSSPGNKLVPSPIYLHLFPPHGTKGIAGGAFIAA